MTPWAEIWCRVWGGTEQKFRKQKFWWPFFSHQPHFVCLLPVWTVNLILCIIHAAYTSLFQNKTFLQDTFFSRFILCHASNNTTSRNIGGERMHLKFCGDRPPQSPLSLRPCMTRTECLQKLCGEARAQKLLLKCITIIFPHVYSTSTKTQCTNNWHHADTCEGDFPVVPIQATLKYSNNYHVPQATGQPLQLLVSKVLREDLHSSSSS